MRVDDHRGGHLLPGDDEGDRAIGLGVDDGELPRGVLTNLKDRAAPRMMSSAPAGICQRWVQPPVPNNIRYDMTTP